MIDKTKEEKQVLFNRLKKVIDNSDNPEINKLLQDLSIRNLTKQKAELNNEAISNELEISCKKCGETTTEKDEQIRQLQTRIEQTENDISIINNKYIAQMAKNEELLKEMDKLEKEVEQLSQSLFEEANQLVSEESKKKYLIEQRNLELEEQIKALKSKLELKNEDHLRKENVDVMDDVELEAFQSFLVNFIKTKPRLIKTPYLKPIIEEDLDQIIKFSGVKSYKFIVLVCNDLIKIEKRKSPDTGKRDKCFGCAKNVEDEYFVIELEPNFRISVESYCKGKIEITKQFVEFMLQLRDGKFMKKRVNEIYQMFFGFRQKFFYFKLGVSINDSNAEFLKSSALDELRSMPNPSPKKFSFGF